LFGSGIVAVSTSNTALTLESDGLASSGISGAHAEKNPKEIMAHFNRDILPPTLSFQYLGS
jgi:hypothetical protein